MRRITLITLIMLVLLTSIPIVFAGEPSGIINVEPEDNSILNVILDFFANVLLTIILWRVIMTIIKVIVRSKRKKNINNN